MLIVGAVEGVGEVIAPALAGEHGDPLVLVAPALLLGFVRVQASTRVATEAAKMTRAKTRPAHSHQGRRAAALMRPSACSSRPCPRTSPDRPSGAACRSARLPRCGSGPC